MKKMEIYIGSFYKSNNQDLEKLYQIQELINKSQLYFQTENRQVLQEYIQTLIKQINH